MFHVLLLGRRRLGVIPEPLPRFSLLQGNSWTLFTFLRTTQESNIGPLCIRPLQSVLPRGEWQCESPSLRDMLMSKHCPFHLFPPSPLRGIFIKSKARNKLFYYHGFVRNLFNLCSMLRISKSILKLKYESWLLCSVIILRSYCHCWYLKHEGK